MAYRHDLRPPTSDGRPRTPVHPGSRASRESSPAGRGSRRSHMPDSFELGSASQTINLRPRPYPHTNPPTHRPTPSRRQSWPRYSIVEDEKASLAKEAHPVKADADQAQARVPGSIDQTPIILDAAELHSRSSASSLKNNESGHRKHDPRLRVNISRGAESPKAQSVRGPNDDAELCKTTEFVDFAERAQRFSTPYAFTPKRDPRPSPTDSGYFSSADVLTEKRKQARAFKDSAMSDALRGEGKLRESQQLRHARAPSYDSERGRATLSSQQDIKGPPKDAQLSPRDMGTRPKLTAVKADTPHSPRRSSETATTLPRAAFNGSLPTTPTSVRPLPVGSFAARNTYNRVFDSRSETSSRPSSPVSFTTSPPETPGSEYPSTRPAPSSRRWSARHPGSKTSSRAPSPDEQMRRSSTFPNLQQDHPFGHGRQSSTSSSIDEYCPRDAYAPYPPSLASSLPYPVDDMGMMPSVDDHRHRSRLQDGLTMPSIPAHREVPPGPTTTTSEIRSVHGNLVARPRLPSSRTANDALPLLSTTSRMASGALTASPSDTRSCAFVPPKAPLPCTRTRSTRDYNDWYTLEGLPEFDICPDCLHNTFDNTSFRNYFKRAKPSDSRTKTRCDFANEWIRLAWLMTQRQRRRDLDLVYAVAKIGVKEGVCPGDHDDQRTWYTLLDRDGNKLDHFDVCRTDVRRIKALVPEVSDAFVRAYGKEDKTRKCDLRTQSHRFDKYLDKLYEVIESATRNRRAPDVQEFVEYARQRARVRACNRAEPRQDEAWHFHPSLPEFTVCEECYTDFVWPHIEDGSLLAGRFLQTPHVMYSSDWPREQAPSCQLYSPRMRAIFDTACKTENFERLKTKAVERRNAEIYIKSKQVLARNALKRASAEGLTMKMDSIKRDLRKMADDWMEFE